MPKEISKIKIATAVIAALAIIFWVLWKNIFPGFSYEFDMDNENRNRIKEEIIAGERFIIYPVDILDTRGDYLFDRVSANFKFKEKLKNDLKITIVDGLEALLYPIGKPIENRQELEYFLFYQNNSRYPNGSIFAYDDSAYFVSKGQYLPIFSADVFVRNGFAWEKLLKADGDAMIELEEGEKFHYYSPHPDGTILRLEKQDFYLVWEKQLLPLDEKILSEVWPEYNWADVSENKSLFNSCHLAAGEEKFKCVFLDDSKRKGVAYILKLGNQSPSVDKFKIKMKTSIKRDIKETLAIFIQRIKADLVYKYGEKL